MSNNSLFKSLLMKILVVCGFCSYPLILLIITLSKLLFSVIKAHVCHHGVLGHRDVDQNIDDTYVYIHLFEAVFSVTPDDALEFFHHCGYI